MPAYTCSSRLKSSVLLSAAIFSTTLVTACNDSEKIDHTRQELAVIASEPTPLHGAFFVSLGYQVDFESGYQRSVDWISDFEFQWGLEVTARLEVVTLAEPYEDGPSVTYRLLEVMDTKEDEIGTRYEYENVMVVSNPAFKVDEENEGYYLFYSETFKCAPAVNCDQLVRMSEDVDNFNPHFLNLHFEYLGQSDDRPTAVMLTYWN